MTDLAVPQPGDHHARLGQHPSKETAEMAKSTPRADHPHTDPGDGRTECERCGKYVWPVIHSCKGIPVTAPARARQRPRIAIAGNPCCGGNGVEASCEVCRRD